MNIEFKPGDTVPIVNGSTEYHIQEISNVTVDVRGIKLRDYVARRYNYLMERLDMIRSSRDILSNVYKFPEVIISVILEEYSNLKLDNFKFWGRLDVCLDNDGNLWSSEFNDRTIGTHEFKLLNLNLPDGTDQFIDYMLSHSRYPRVGVLTYPDSNPNKELRYNIEYLYPDKLIPVTPDNYQVVGNKLEVYYNGDTYVVDVLWKMMGATSIVKYIENLIPILKLYKGGKGYLKVFNPFCEDILGYKYFSLFDEYTNQPISFLYNQNMLDVLKHSHRYVVKSAHGWGGTDVYFTPLGDGLLKSGVEYIVQERKTISMLPTIENPSIKVQSSIDPYVLGGELVALLCRGLEPGIQYTNLITNYSNNNIKLHKYVWSDVE